MVPPDSRIIALTEAADEAIARRLSIRRGCDASRPRRAPSSKAQPPARPIYRRLTRTRGREYIRQGRKN
jgi:hypothetical protein